MAPPRRKGAAVDEAVAALRRRRTGKPTEASRPEHVTVLPGRRTRVHERQMVIDDIEAA